MLAIISRRPCSRLWRPTGERERRRRYGDADPVVERRYGDHHPRAALGDPASKTCTFLWQAVESPN
jgi:hypothetical protein